MKEISIVLSLIFSLQAFASHPHDSLCVVKGKTKSLESVALFLQIQSEREYASGNPNEDIHDFTYQARICNDDNDSTSCSTFKSLAPTHKPDATFSLVGMVDQKKVLFSGNIVNGKTLVGRLLTPGESKTYEDFSGDMNCIAQSWIELKAEDDSMF
jgi:hypothetical protein